MSVGIYYLPHEHVDVAADDPTAWAPRVLIQATSPWLGEDAVARSVVITPRLQSAYINGSTHGFRFSMTVDSADGLDKEIFLYLADPPRPGDVERTARFHKVCSPADLVIHPADDPLEGVDPPWVRLDHLTLDFYTRADAMRVHDAILADVASLLSSFAYMDKLEPGAPVMISIGE